jgi:hypothetical protein
MAIEGPEKSLPRWPPVNSPNAGKTSPSAVN